MTMPLPSLPELLKASRWSEVLAQVERAESAGAVTAEAATAAYRAHLALGDAPAAEAWLDRALALSKNNTTLLHAKGVLHQKRREWLKAASLFERAASLRPDAATYHGSLGVAMLELGEHGRAMEALQRGLSIDATRRAWWIRLARSQLHLGHRHDALRAFDKALALQDDASVRSARDELLRQIRDGSRTASAAYYDAVFTDSPKYQQPGQSSSYLPAWQLIAKALQDAGTTSILDLGCGPGQFAEFIASQLPRMQYTGLDFSAVAIAQARSRCPQFLFEKRELPISQFEGLPAFDMVVCTEVLEHVERDIEILAALPTGVPIIASVPSFDSFGHVRLFRTEAEVTERYGAWIGGLQVRAIALSEQSTLWLMQGVRSDKALAADETGPAGQAGFIDLGAHAVDCVLWTDGSRYVQDFLPQFGLPFVTVAESVGLQEPHVAMRHDVDHSIENAWAMACIERQLGIRSSYYLLHPDGDITHGNYFGRVEGDRLVIDPTLFDWAARLIDLGHEVGLHNDLISLALATRRQPGEFLEQIVEAFTRRGIALRGSVAHRSRTCRDLAYLNYQIFSELQQSEVAVDYRDSPELLAHATEPEVRRDGHAVRKFMSRMADFGLQYEANFVPRELYVSDSSARWSLWHGAELTRFERAAPRVGMAASLAALLRAKKPHTAVQCLVHACHWSVLVQPRKSLLPGHFKQRNEQLAELRRASIVERLQAFDNVLLARASTRFDQYDQEYGSKLQKYKVGSTVASFISRLLAGPAATCTRVMEIGCGQGDFVASVHRQLLARHAPDRVRSLGVDGSPAAVLACAGRYPDIDWVADELEHFLEVHDELVHDDDGRALRHDLVLDKTGAIFIRRYAEARNFFSSLERLLRPGGLYVYVASRNYYENELRKKNFVDWPHDWLALAAETFEVVGSDDDNLPELRGYYKRVFRKRVAP
jgi:trans-aconitate methyltransferase